MNPAGTPSTIEFWRRAWLHELGLDWRADLPVIAGPDPIPAVQLEPPSAAEGTAEVARDPEVAAGEPTDLQPVPTPIERAAADADASVSAPAPARDEAPAVAPDDTPGQAAVATPALVHAWPAIDGAWRWSWWRGTPPAALAQALLLRPAGAASPTDVQARTLLAAALQAIGLAPEPRGARPVGGVWTDGVTVARLADAARDVVPEALPLVVIWCLPADQAAALAPWSDGQAVPGTQWRMTGTRELQLVVLPAPENMLATPSLKRVAWQALAPLRDAG